MRKTFKTTIVRDGAMCFIPVLFDPRSLFGKVRAPVKVTLNGYTYRSTVASMGNGPCIPLRRNHLGAAGLHGHETLSVMLELDTEKREIKPPPDFVRALKAKPPAWDRWLELSYSHQREHVEAIEETKKPETRARRIDGAVRMVASRPPRPATSRKEASASSPPRLNAAWYKSNPMLKSPTLGQRIAWHKEHAKRCGCRPVPAKLRARMLGRDDGGERWRPAREGRWTMTRYTLLLRGVNVGTKNSLPMAELRTMLEKIGCADVQTYVQSGNAVFDTKLGAADLTKAIEKVLGQYMGRPIATTLRTHAQMTSAVDANPFAEVATNPAYLCVTFLSQAPTKSEIAPLYAQDFKPELFHVSGKEIYTWHPNGQGRSPLAAALGKLPLRGAVTTRNWNTALKLLEMLGDNGRSASASPRGSARRHRWTGEEKKT